jgi:bifunctional non-homologous end joining protein LigD
MLADLQERLSAIETERPPIEDPEIAKVRGAHWVKPELVCEVEFLQITSAFKLRAPSFKGLRPDKLPEDAVLEGASAEATAEAPEQPAKTKTRARPTAKRASSATAKRTAGASAKKTGRVAAKSATVRTVKTVKRAKSPAKSAKSRAKGAKPATRGARTRRG